jgi:hypothetical protein
MVRAVQHVFAATLNGLNPPDRPERKEHCFELFGVDTHRVLTVRVREFLVDVVKL